MQYQLTTPYLSIEEFKTIDENIHYADGCYPQMLTASFIAETQTTVVSLSVDFLLFGMPVELIVQDGTDKMWLSTDAFHFGVDKKGLESLLGITFIDLIVFMVTCNNV